MSTDTLASVEQRIAHLIDNIIPGLQGAIAKAEAQKSQAEEALTTAGWDGVQDPAEFVAELDRRAQELTQQAAQAVQEAEDAIRAIGSQSTGA